MTTSSPTSSFIDAINALRSVLPAQRNAVVEIRPTAVAVDPNLSGWFRFCYSRGNSPAILASNTEITITEGCDYGAVELVTTDSPPEDWTDCVLVLDNQEPVLVTGMNTTTDAEGVETTTLSLANPVLNPHVAGMRCTLSAFCVVAPVGREYELGALAMVIQTPRLVVAGDVLQILIDPTTPTLSRGMRIGDATRVDCTDGLSTYNITLLDPLVHAFDGSQSLFIQARPAYESRRLAIPGPARGVVAVDVHGGETQGQGVLTATFAINAITADEKLLQRRVLASNAALVLNQIQAHELACASVDRGELAWSGNVLRVTLDDEGLAGFGFAYDTEVSVALNLVAHCDTGFYFGIDAGDWAWTQALADTDTQLLQTSTCKHIVLRFRGTPGAVVVLRNAASQVRAHSLAYTMCFELHANEALECSGLLFKPFHHSIHDIQTHTRQVQGEDVVIELNHGTCLC